MTMLEAYRGRSGIFTPEHSSALIGVELQFQEALVEVNRVEQKSRRVLPPISTPHVIRHGNGGVAKQVVTMESMQRVLSGELKEDAMPPVVKDGEIQRSWSSITFHWPESDLHQIRRQVAVTIKGDNQDLLEVSAMASSCPAAKVVHGSNRELQEFYRSENMIQMPLDFDPPTMQESLVKAIGTVFSWSAGHLIQERMVKILRA